MLEISKSALPDKTLAVFSWSKTKELEADIRALEPPKCGRTLHEAGIILAVSLNDWLVSLITDANDVNSKLRAFENAGDVFVEELERFRELADLL